MIGMAIVLILASITSCRDSEKTGTREPQRTKVVVTLFPLYDFARSIGGERTDLTLLLPPGVEAHSFEPKPGDLVKINEADVFIYTGRIMEPWAEDMIKGVTNRKLLIVDASRGTRMAKGDHKTDDHNAGLSDPHIWLDFENAGIMVRSIAAALEQVDPSGRDYYRQRADACHAMLVRLDDEFRSALKSCRNKEIVYGGHYAFGYMAARYGLKYQAAQGISPDAEPTARDLARLVEQVRRERISYIFYEELTSPKVAQTISQETGAGMLMLSAAHNVTRDQFERGVTFEEIMKANLENLKVGLGCGR